MNSLLAPRFLERRARPEVRTVLLAGCGGGFDFVHAMLLVPELVRLGKDRAGEIFLWPIRACDAVDACYAAVTAGRRALGASLRDVENIPPHEQLRGRRNPWR
jgi:hypothetical protein